MFKGKVLEKLKKKALAGDEEAQIKVGYHTYLAHDMQYWHEMAWNNKKSNAAGLVLGCTYMQGNEYSKGLEIYHILEDRKCKEVYVELGLCYYLGDGVKKDFTIATEYFLKSVKENPDDPWAYIRLGDICQKLDQDRSAVRWYNRGLDVSNSIRNPRKNTSEIIAGKLNVMKVKNPYAMIPWGEFEFTKMSYLLFPMDTRIEIKQFLLCFKIAKREGLVLGTLHKDLVNIVIAYIATENEFNIENVNLF